MRQHIKTFLLKLSVISTCVTRIDWNVVPKLDFYFKLNLLKLSLKDSHFVKSVRIRSYSGPHFPTFGLNTDRNGVSLKIQSGY